MSLFKFFISSANFFASALERSNLASSDFFIAVALLDKQIEQDLD